MIFRSILYLQIKNSNSLSRNERFSICWRQATFLTLMTAVTTSQNSCCIYWFFSLFIFILPLKIHENHLISGTLVMTEYRIMTELIPRMFFWSTLGQALSFLNISSLIVITVPSFLADLSWGLMFSWSTSVQVLKPYQWDPWGGTFFPYKQNNGVICIKL